MSSATATQQLTPFGHALAGALGGVFSNAVVYPLDTIKTRIQAEGPAEHGKRKITVWSIFMQVLKEEGISGFYDGFGASMLNTFSTQYAYFFFYSFIRKSYISRIMKKLPAGSRIPALSTAVELLLGALAGALAQIFTIPVSVIATRQQLGQHAYHHRNAAGPSAPAPSAPSQVSSDKPSFAAVADPAKPTEKQTAAARAQRYDNSFLTVGREIIREEGVKGLWLGLGPSLVLTVNPAITYGAFERVKSLILLAKEKAGASLKLTAWQAFFIGALSKSLATVVTYPYIMAKVRIQAGSDEVEEDLPQTSKDQPVKHKYKHLGALDILGKVLKEDGILGWYQGMGAQITKAVLSQALLFMSKDQFEHYALIIMLLWRRMVHSS